MALLDVRKRQAIQEVVDRWRERCLLEDGSLLFDHEQVWTPENLALLYHNVIEAPLEDERSFLEKYREQLQIVTSALTQLAELESERAGADRTFNKREKQIRAQIRSVAAFFGGLQGVAGGALQPVVALELPPPSDEEQGPLALAS